MIVSDNPANFVQVTVTPKQSADLPDITMGTAMRAGTQLALVCQRKLHNIVRNICHKHQIVWIQDSYSTKNRTISCDTALINPKRGSICACSETCVEPDADGKQRAGPVQQAV